MNDTKYLDLIQWSPMDSEIARLRRLLAERDKMIDELLPLLNEMTDKLLANVKEQHQRLVFNIEHRTPVD